MGNYGVLPCFFVFNDSEENFSTLSICAGRQVYKHTKHEHMYEGIGKCLICFTVYLIKSTWL